MRTHFNFEPLYRSSIGFDRIFNLLEDAIREPAEDNWPPYDIAKTGDDAFRISMAVAGFAEKELEISTEPNLLVVSGAKDSEIEGEFLHRGITNRPFTRRFELADHVKVVGANLTNGLLTIDLMRELPEAMKPRQIEIAAASAETKQLENRRNAA